MWFYLEQWAAFLESHSVCALSRSQTAPSHERMPHNAIVSQAASTTLLTPLAAVRLKENMEFSKLYQQKYKCKETINDGDGERGAEMEQKRK